ncbi:RGS domain-containing protein [Caenorhabditis elegans]|uniref:RGS domain-containing protein n=1 Tax=Caenorhabditis elegans TaxID=6239 RepID=Q21405_CAEEL|nr:RGS domain-containing protein [Caenorhabditis elegans]CCD67564.2 RGS domain-containing protein [Caenorhabditis elegans]|eukprot:NP_509307.2 Uncharacterized protein CELE_K09F5.1 [Caenorhabditis elegans]
MGTELKIDEKKFDRYIEYLTAGYKLTKALKWFSMQTAHMDLVQKENLLNYANHYVQSNMEEVRKYSMRILINHDAQRVEDIINTNAEESQKYDAIELVEDSRKNKLQDFVSGDLPADLNRMLPNYDSFQSLPILSGGGVVNSSSHCQQNNDLEDMLKRKRTNCMIYAGKAKSQPTKILVQTIDKSFEVANVNSSLVFGNNRFEKLDSKLNNLSFYELRFHIDSNPQFANTADELFKKFVFKEFLNKLRGKPVNKKWRVYLEELKDEENKKAIKLNMLTKRIGGKMEKSVVKKAIQLETPVSSAAKRNFGNLGAPNPRVGKIKSEGTVTPPIFKISKHTGSLKSLKKATPLLAKCKKMCGRK